MLGLPISAPRVRNGLDPDVNNHVDNRSRKPLGSDRLLRRVLFSVSRLAKP